MPAYLVQLSEALVDQIVTLALKTNVGARGLWPLLRDLETRLLLDPPTGPGERYGVRFGWRLRMLADQLQLSVRTVIENHHAKVKALMNAPP